MDDLRRLLEDIGTEERLRTVAEFPIAEIRCAPGHRTLRDPEAVGIMADEIARGALDRILAEPILLGLFTEESLLPEPSEERVRLRAVECLDGNHRLLAGLLSGRWQRVGDIPIHALDARVNGWPAHALAAEVRWIPLEVAQASELDPSAWSQVPASWGAKGPTAQIPGWISGLDEVIPERFRSISIGALLDEWRKAQGATDRAR